MPRKDDNSSHAPRIVNRKARHDYFVSESLEVGIMLTGSEVKSIRTGQVSLAEGFARVEPADRSLWLYNVDIPPYAHAHGAAGHEPKRPRKLLAHKREISKLHDLTVGKGTTLIPLTLYFLRGRVKIELGVCEGKKAYDKRQDLRKREADREMQRGMTRKRL
ncbi:MAG: SsrA-binding protein SmpB [Phycisphaeraceae bacterium]